MNIKKFLNKRLVAAVLIGIAVIFAAVKLWPKPLDRRYELTRVARENITQTVTASGRIRSAAQAELRFSAGGLISWVGVKEGDQVKKWQALASLDKRELEKNLQKYLLDFSKERADFDEDLKVTYRDKVLTDTISRILAKNQYDLDKAVLDVEIKDLAIKLATVTSPIDGIITYSHTPVAGVNILATEPAFIVADPEQLVFEAEFDETDVGTLAVGQTAALTLDAFPDNPIDVTVGRIDFNATIDSGGATVYQAEFILPQNGQFRLGLNGEVMVTVAAKDQALTVPYASVDTDNQVRVVRNNRLETVSVTTGITADDKLEILSGLNEGDQIVVAEID